MRTYIALALLLTVLTMSHAKKLLVETEDEDMGHEPVFLGPDPIEHEIGYSMEYDVDGAEPKRRRNKSGTNKALRKPFEQHIKAFRG